jgi:MFS family permease
MSDKNISLGLKENWLQFTILVIINAFVGAMIGLERSILPSIAENEFNMIAKSAIFSFIVVFGFTKAFTNYFAGRLSEQYGRKFVLILGWIVAIPFPFILMYANSWNWVIFANILLGISQGLTWSTTVIMKVDLVGPSKRGLAMGLNEFAGYFAVAGSALSTGYIASYYHLRPEPFYLGVLYVIAGLLMSIFLVKETKEYAILEAKLHHTEIISEKKSQKEIFIFTSFKNKELSSVTQAGFVNNLNDGMAWGLFPLFFASKGLDIKTIAILSSIYPFSWGIFQLFTGYWSDKVGRKWLIVWGMWLQAIGIILTVVSSVFYGFALGALFLGIGTAMVYPTLLASIGDVAHPSWRASSVGIYRLWRDSGYAIGAIISGITADLFGLDTAIWFVAFITFLSGWIVVLRMKETLIKLNR